MTRSFALPSSRRLSFFENFPKPLGAPGRGALAALLAGAAAASVSTAQAASDTWTGSGGDNLWQTVTNWASGTQFPGTASAVYTSTDDATFSTAGATGTIGLGGTINIRTLIYGTGGGDAASFTVGSGTDTLNFTTAGGITINSGVTTAQTVGSSGTTINLSNTLTAANTFANDGTGTLTIAGNVVQNAPTGSTTSINSSLLTVTGSGNTAITGTITNAGATLSATVGTSLLKTGTGTLTLSNGSVWAGNAAQATASATNQYPLVVRSGTLLLNGGTHAVTGEAVIGGFTTAGATGNNAKIQVDSGALTVSTWLSIGRGNGTGTVSSDLVLNNAASVTAANLSAGFNGGSTSNLPKGSITLNGTSSLNISSGGSFFLAESAGSNFTMTLNDSSTVTINGNGTAVNRIIGGNPTGNGTGTTGTVNINGSANFTDASTGALNVGYQNGTGVLNINSGTFNHANGEVRVGASNTSGVYNGTGTINMSGGTATVGALTLARGNSNTALINGTLNLTGGTFTSTGDVVVGYAGNGNLGQINISGGTFNVGTTALKWLMVGTWDTTRGEMNISNGALNLNSSSAIKMNRQTGTGANIITQSGGTVTFYSDNGTTVGGTGHLDMQYSGAAASSNTYHLNGGTLTVPQVISTATTGTRTFNFNGGTLKAAITTTAFFNLGSGTGTARANVRNGGAIIDTNGFDVTVAQALLHSNIGGDNATDGGLTKNGTGTLTLTGANTYTGATTVTNGSLALGSSSTLQSATGNVNVSGGTLSSTVSSSTLGGNLNISGGTLASINGTSAGTLTLASGADFSMSSGTWTLDLATLDSIVGGGTGSQFTLTGGTFALSNAAQTTYTLLSGFDASLTNVASGITVTGLAGNQFAVLSVSGGSLNLTVIPEPGEYAVAIGGLLAVMILVRRRKAVANS